VDRALRLARSLPPDAIVGNRDEALAALAAGVAQSDPERALGIAADIHSEFNHGEFSREVALQAIITAMAHRDLSRALSLLPRVRDTERKVFFLLELAREKGWNAARRRQWLSLAAATARRLPDPADRVEWLTRIVTDAALGTGIARPLLRQAYALALQRVNASGRDQALTAVAGAAVEREPDWAMRVAGHIHSEAARAGAVRLLSGPLARHDPARALRRAIRCPLLADRCGALVGIAEALAPAPGS